MLAGQALKVHVGNMVSKCVSQLGLLQVPGAGAVVRRALAADAPGVECEFGEHDELAALPRCLRDARDTGRGTLLANTVRYNIDADEFPRHEDGITSVPRNDVANQDDAGVGAA